MTFSALLTPARVDVDRFVMTVPDGWQQGRGAFGGLVIGTMVRAATIAVDDVSRVVRAVNAELLGPVVVGEATLHLDRLRQGGAVSAIRVRLVQADDELAQAVVLFGKDRPSTPAWSTSTPPATLTSTPWTSLELAPVGPPIAPVFTQHFEFRVTGALPLSGAAVAAAEGYIRAKDVDAGAVVDAAVVAATVDAWWPTAWARFDEPRPTATVSYALQVCGDLDDVDASAPLLHRAFSDVAHGGYSVEHRALWTPSGRLLAQNQQVFAIIR